MKITYEQIKALSPCYSNQELKELLPEEADITLEALLRLPASDARWLVSKLLTSNNRVVWANACAKRAKAYSDADADAYAPSAARAAYYAADATYAASSAAHAARAAYAAAPTYADAAYAYAPSADAAAYAPSAARAAAYASAAEHRKAMEHAIELLG